MNWFGFTKKNPVQEQIRQNQPEAITSVPNNRTAAAQFEKDPTFNRCMNMLIDSSQECIIQPVSKITMTAMQKGNYSITDLRKLMALKPNPYQDASQFWRLLYTDYYMTGRQFQYWDGASLFHWPEHEVTVVAGSNSVVSHYEFQDKKYLPDSVLFVKDNAYLHGVGQSAISANSRYKAAENDIIRKDGLSMFKERFLQNGCLMGLILETDSVLSNNFKSKILDTINVNYNSRNGKFMNSAMILDGGLKQKSTSQVSMNDLSINEDKEFHDKAICTALGVPPILLDSGNNQNLRPNIDLMYGTTILPQLSKFTSALAAFFGYYFEVNTKGVFALAPDTEKEQQRVVSLVNNGIMTQAEQRVQLGLPVIKDPRLEEIRIPQNVSGSQTGVSGQEGGKPPQDKE